MKITFIQDCPAIIESGNEAYKAGTQADLRKGQELIDLGYAREGWDTGLVDRANEFNPDYSHKSALENEPIEYLRELAKSNGVKGYARMKRETLIERLI